MKRTLFLLVIFLLIIAVLGPWRTAQASTTTWRTLDTPANKIDPALQIELKNLQATQMTTVIVTLRQRADLSRVGGDDRQTRRQEILRKLYDTANATQGPLRTLFNLRRRQGRVEKFESLWIINGFSLTASADFINELAKHPNVFSISPDDISIVPTAIGSAETNLNLVNSPPLWDAGFTGQGVVVANLDSGVDATHLDLADHWRGGSNSWFDPYGEHPSTPTDLTGHGTWTMGVMVGGDLGGTTIGMAPNAQWIAAKIFNDQGNSTATIIHQSYQWILDPDNDPLTDDAPDVVNNSWTFAYPGCNLEFATDLENLRAAGILPVFSAGNGGPYANTSYSPANNPAAFAVGAINNSSGLYAYSSRGPSTCGGSTSVYPDIVAPGVNIRTTDLYGNYTTATGTSLAAPHVAGALALLLSAYPNLPADQQESALLNTTFDLGASGPDTNYGNGRMDVLAAFNWLAIAPTATPVPVSTDTPLPLPTDTPTETPISLPSDTLTALPPTATSTSLPTNTPSPEPPTPTPTNLPPTQTPTPLPTATPTLVPPTRTPTATSTQLPPTNTKTPTAIPPTNTPTAMPPTPTSTALPSTSTGYLSPSANVAVTTGSGDNNGYQTNPANAYTDNGVFAVDTNSGNGTSTLYTNNQKDRHTFYNYNLSIPSNAVIQGIQVRLDAKVDATSGAPKIYVQLSWDGGITWTTALATTNLTTGEITYVLGGTANTWGRPWTAANFSNANFRVRVIDVSSNTSRDFSLDYIAVNVTYQP